MRAIPKWLAEGDAHETVREQAESFLGQRRAKHVFAQGFAATRILCPSMGRGMQREAKLGDREGRRHFDAGMAT